jgi:signal peptidase I
VNTLQINDRILVNELVPAVVPVQHGVVVVFTDPGGWLVGEPIAQQPGGIVGAVDGVLSLVGLTSPDSNNHLVKRVIGLPGDMVLTNVARDTPEKVGLQYIGRAPALSFVAWRDIQGWFSELTPCRLRSRIRNRIISLKGNPHSCRAQFAAENTSAVLTNRYESIIFFSRV